MAWFKLLNHEKKVITEVEYKGDLRTSEPFTRAKCCGITHLGVEYRWKEYDEAFQSNKPEPQKKIMTLVRYRCPGCTHSFFLSCRVCGTMRCSFCTRDFRGEGNEGETLTGELTVME